MFLPDIDVSASFSGYMTLIEEVLQFGRKLGLTSTETDILYVLVYFNPLLLPTRLEIATKMKMSTTTVNRAFSKFKKLGYLTRLEKGYDFSGLLKALAGIAPDVRERQLGGVLHECFCPPSPSKA